MNKNLVHSNIKKTRTYTYLAPLLNEIIKLEKSRLINLYLGDENENHKRGKLFAWFKYCGTLSCVNYEKEIKEQATKFYNPDEYSFMCVFEIPENKLHIYNCFIEGKFSKFPEEYKKKLLLYHKQDNKSKLSMILRKHPREAAEIEKKIGMKLPVGAEVISRPDWNDEIFKEEYKYVNPLDRSNTI